MDIKGDLLQLRQQIVRELYLEQWREVWFYPPDPVQKVEGWLGTDPIMFVGLNPSGGHFPSPADRAYYAGLRSYGLASAHLTDVCKVRATRDERDQVLYDAKINALSRGYFEREVELIRPLFVVAMLPQTQAILQDWFDTSLNIYPSVEHYSRDRQPNAKFLSELAKIRAKFLAARDRA